MPLCQSRPGSRCQCQPEWTVTRPARDLQLELQVASEPFSNHADTRLGLRTRTTSRQTCILPHPRVICQCVTIKQSYKPRLYDCLVVTRPEITLKTEGPTGCLQRSRLPAGHVRRPDSDVASDPPDGKFLFHLSRLRCGQRRLSFERSEPGQVPRGSWQLFP
jgi:hypothetical protein